MRVWEVTSHQQLYEFGGGAAAAGAGSPTCAAYHPHNYQLAVGYTGGLMRLFDVATTTLLLVRDCVLMLWRAMGRRGGAQWL